MLTASFWLLRLSSGIFKPKNCVLGGDISGTVTAIGQNVTKFKLGDRVLGRCKSGALAEFCSLNEKSVAKIPDKVSFENAATIPLAAVTALSALQAGMINENQQVLINGASGGIGTIAIQLARYFKATVTGVCSSSNINLVKSLGACEVIDYETMDFTSTNKKYDLIVDLVGNRSIYAVSKILKPQGKCILVGMDKPRRLFSNMFIGMIISSTSKKNINLINAETRSEDLAFLVNLLEEGKLVAVIDKTYDFNSIPEAFEYLGSKRTRGKLLITM